MALFPDPFLVKAEKLLALCRTHGVKIATAESCTGGLVAALLTEIPGSSDVFERGYVTYSNRAKKEELNVNAELLEQFGAVSEQVAHAMAQGAIYNSGAHLSVSVTGIAGPGGGTAMKPVGLVYFCSIFREAALPKKQVFSGDRAQIRLAAVDVALDLMIEQVR